MTEFAASPLMGTAKLPKPMVPTKAENQPINSDDMGRDSGVASPAFAQHFRYATEFRKMRKELCARERDRERERGVGRGKVGV